MSLLGRFLELSVMAPDIAESVHFYETLGFRQLETGDTWTHKYAALTDGMMTIGLHDYAFDSPALTFVLPGLADRIAEFDALGISRAFEKTGDEEFNEAGFTDPSGHMITLLEARTYSPPAFREQGFSALGDFLAYAIPSPDVAGAHAFWTTLGLTTLIESNQPAPHALLAGAGTRISLHTSRRLRTSEVRYASTNLAANAAELTRRGIAIDVDSGADNDLLVRAPEDVCFRVSAAEAHG